MLDRVGPCPGSPPAKLVCSSLASKGVLVAVKKEQIDDICARLDKIEQELGMRPKPPSWWRARYEWVIAHKGTSLILAVVLCIVGIFGGGYFKYWLDHRSDPLNDRIEKVLSAPGGIKGTLSSVQLTVTATDATLKALSPFIQDVIRHQFESVSKLSAAELQGRLPAIRNLLAIAKNQDVKIKPEIPAGLGVKLLQVQPSAPDFWPLAGDLISYRSFNTVAWTHSASLPNCVDLPPVITTQAVSFMLGGPTAEIASQAWGIPRVSGYSGFPRRRGAPKLNVGWWHFNARIL